MLAFIVEQQRSERGFAQFCGVCRVDELQTMRARLRGTLTSPKSRTQSSRSSSFASNPCSGLQRSGDGFRFAQTDTQVLRSEAVTRERSHERFGQRRQRAAFECLLESGHERWRCSAAGAISSSPRR